jgi:thiol-disulfide isomerase/thioredoxin
MLAESQNKAQAALTVDNGVVVEEKEKPLQSPVNNKKSTDERKELTPAQKIRKRNFWLQVGAWVVALALLITALVYYNAFDKLSDVEVSTTGNAIPEFTVDTFDTAGAYDKDGNRILTFSSQDYIGTVMVLNFWYTTCDPCKAELPYFNDVYEEYGDQIYMVAFHAAGYSTKRQIQQFLDTEVDINGKKWSDYNILFALDTEELNLFETLGGKDAYPTTVIIDKEGNIAYVNPGALSEDKLRAQIEDVLAR